MFVKDSDIITRTIYTVTMSVLMFVNYSSEKDWPTARAMERFRAKTVDAPLMVFRYRPETADDRAFVNAVAREFELAGHAHGHGVRLVLTGSLDPALAGRLYRERGVPVNVVFSAVVVDDVGRFDAFRTMAGVTISSWRLPVNDADVVMSALAFANALSDDYRSYVNDLRDIPSAANVSTALVDDSAYATIMNEYGEGVRAVELVLDALLEQLCGTVDIENNRGGYGRWMSPAAVIEHGDRVAADAWGLRCRDPTVSVEYTRRATRTAASFAATLWHDFDGHPTATDRALATCLVQNLRAAADQELVDLPADRFAMCLNAKFAATRIWRESSGGPVPRPFRSDTSGSKLFHQEIRNRCERFLGIGHLVDLMATGDDRVFGRSGVEHLESYVLPQTLIEYTSRYYHREVRYFALDDTLVFRFTDGKSGQLAEQMREYRFAGPKNFNEFHNERLRSIAAISHFGGGGTDSDEQPLEFTNPNIFFYRNCGYSKMVDNTVQIISVNGETKVRMEVYRLYDEDTVVEQMHRTKVEHGEFWVTVHNIITIAGQETELVMGMADGTVVAVTRMGDGTYRTFARSTSGRSRTVLDRYEWPDGRSMLEYKDADPIVVATSTNGTQVIANFGDLRDFVCEVYVSDGSKIRTRIGPAVEYCGCDPVRKPTALLSDAVSDNVGGDSSGGADDDNKNDERCDGDKYVVCRRDLSGYEFVDRPVESAWRQTVKLDPKDASSLSSSSSSYDDARTESSSGVMDGGEKEEKGSSSTGAELGETSDDAVRSVTTVVRTITPSPFDDGTASLVNKMLSDHFDTIKTLADRLNAECRTADNVESESDPDILNTNVSRSTSAYYVDEQWAADEQVTSDS